LRAVPPGAVARPPAAIPRTPVEALRSGTQALRDGNPDQAVTALEYAAQQGMPGAMWKLGKMFADGDGVDQNKLRAFEYFRNLTKSHSYDPPGSPQSRFVASAFVSLGHFYLEGIPDTEVKVDLMMAHEMFRYAASYFGDSEAQYQLGRLHLSGQGAAKDPVQAARWFRLAASKGQRYAQAMLGTMLFKGQGVQRQTAMGLFWLTVAKDGVGADEAWITDTYKSAFAQASEDERALAYRYLTDWLQNRRGAVGRP
jgi:TPR repeat protein